MIVQRIVLPFLILDSFGLVGLGQAFQTRLILTSPSRHSPIPFRPLVPRTASTSIAAPRYENRAASQRSLTLPPLSRAVSTDDGANDTNDASRMQRLRRSIFPKADENGLSFRQRLAKMGLATVLSYGWVSNMSYCVSVAAAWYIFSKRTGLSPLAPGQWKGFLTVYAGFWVFNNVVRPVRLAVSVAVAPKFDALVSMLQTQWKVSRAVAIGVTVVMANIVGTIALMSLGILGASILAGVPVFPKAL